MGGRGGNGSKKEVISCSFWVTHPLPPHHHHHHAEYPGVGSLTYRASGDPDVYSLSLVLHDLGEDRSCLSPCCDWQQCKAPLRNLTGPEEVLLKTREETKLEKRPLVCL